MKYVEQIKTQAANRNEGGEDSSVLAFCYCHVTKTSSRKKQGLFGLTASEVWVPVGYPAVSHQDITVHHGGVQDGGNCLISGAGRQRSRKRTNPTTSIQGTSQ